jgi:hypothetical protein
MSINAIEKALWQASMDPVDAQRLREDAPSYLRDFRLDERESSLLACWDIRAIVELGVHPMVLMMAFAAVNGPAASAVYVEKVNTPGQAGSSR